MPSGSLDETCDWSPARATEPRSLTWKRPTRESSANCSLLPREEYNACSNPCRSATQSARDHQVLDLVGALADLEHLGIAVEAGDRRVEHVSGAAVDLHRLRR